MATLLSKSELRERFAMLRAGISLERREKGASALLQKLSPLLTPVSKVLSFESFGSEIDTSQINALLKRRGALLLPEMFETVTSIPLETIDLILVPGLAFDKGHHRLGYGKGYYDQLLARSHCALSLGIGFHEQQTDLLPRVATDVALDSVCLV